MMPRRALAVALTLLVAMTTAGCAREVDDFPDAYEQAIIDLLDASPVVGAHTARVDGWAHAENVPGTPAEIVLWPDVSEEAWQGLLADLTELGREYGEDVPPLDFDTDGEWADLSFSGSHTPENAIQLVDTATTGDWGRVIAHTHNDTVRVQLWGQTESADDGADLVQRDLPPYVADNLYRQQVLLPEEQAVKAVEAEGGPIHPELFALAFALDDVDELLPDPDDSVTFELRTDWANGDPEIAIHTRIRAAVLTDTEPDSRPAAAEELGYTGVCDRVADLTGEYITIPTVSLRCTATHVEIGDPE